MLSSSRRGKTLDINPCWTRRTFTPVKRKRRFLSSERFLFRPVIANARPVSRFSLLPYRKNVTIKIFINFSIFSRIPRKRNFFKAINNNKRGGATVLIFIKSLLKWLLTMKTLNTISTKYVKEKITSNSGDESHFFFQKFSHISTPEFY